MKIRLVLVCTIFIFSVYSSVSANRLKILIVTGGHDFDRISFFQMFDSFKNITYSELKHPEAGIQLGTINPDSFDAVVFYNMPKTISEQEKESFHKLLSTGKGLLFLHHSICAYQDWPEYESIVGGKYYEKKKDDKFGVSSYEHDIDLTVKIENQSHPVTKGVENFLLHDEVYGNLEIIPEVIPLLSTDHPKSNKLIGWTLNKGKSRIVFIQPGHDKNSYTNPDYRKLVNQAIGYITSFN